MIVSLSHLPIPQRMNAWRGQIGHRHELADRCGPRPFAVISYRVRGRRLDERYVPLRNLTLVILYDLRLDADVLVTRLVGVGASIREDGLVFGGPANSRFDKDLRLAPGREHCGARLEVADGEFFEFALALERYLERCARHPFMPRRTVPRLPVIDPAAVAGEQSLIDLSLLPKRQVLRFDSPQHDLVGRVGSTEFNFVNTRFRVAR